MERCKANGLRRQRRQYRVRRFISGNHEQPRLTVFRSHKHIACQLIDDEKGATLVSVSTRDKDIRDELKYGGNRSAASVIGRKIAEKAKAAGLSRVMFDRGHYKYHGRVAALADAAREAGLQF